MIDYNRVVWNTLDLYLIDAWRGPSGEHFLQKKWTRVSVKLIVKWIWSEVPDGYNCLHARDNIAKGTMDPRVKCSHESICFYIISQFDQHSASKSRSNFSIKISTKRQPQSIDQTLASKPWTDLSLIFQHLTSKSWPNVRCDLLLTSISINIRNKNNINKFWVGIFRVSTPGATYVVSQWVTRVR